MTIKQTMTRYGRCRLYELPRPYRALYKNGRADESATVFVRPGHSLLFYFVFTVACLGLGGFFTAALISGGPILPLERGASIAGPIIAGLICLAFLGAGVWFLLQLIRAIGRHRRDSAQGYHYGLRLDNDALVLRYHARKNGDTCLFLPRHSIGEVRVSRKTVLRAPQGPNRNHIVAYFVELQDVRGNRHSIPGRYLKPTKQQQSQVGVPVIPQADERAATVTAALIYNWLKVG